MSPTRMRPSFFFLIAAPSWRMKPSLGAMASPGRSRARTPTYNCRSMPLGAPEPFAPARPDHRETDEPFRLLVEQVVDYAIYLLDVRGRVSSWNVGAQRINGYAPQ